MAELSGSPIGKSLTAQLEKNIGTLEQDYSLLMFRIQATLSKV